MNGFMEEVKELYHKYGFSVLFEKEGLIAFSYRMGFFSGAEIVVVPENQNQNVVEKAKSDCVDMGYAISDDDVVRLDYEGIHRRLFNAFFNLSSSRDGLKRDYELFCNKQSEQLQNDYKFIESSKESNKEGGLVAHVVATLKESYPCLYILEAAAGYGKTCTAYEITSKLLEADESTLPLFIELSQNRYARVFKYVLQDEINRKFSQLSYDLVLSEIKNGWIPLIIDGFDELIDSKVAINSDYEQSDDSSLSMLSTIADLLDENSKAKIVLTSRRTAILTGDMFNEWVERKLCKECLFDRYQISIPDASDWIGPEKYQLLARGESIDNICNPVMMSFISNNISLEYLQNETLTWDMLLDKYFELLLTREQDRQDLLIEADEQYSIMEKLAAEYARYDFTSEDIEFIQELLENFIDKDFMEYQERYRKRFLSNNGILTKKDYIRRLSHNSLLDRPKDSNQISFINDFILGVLVGDAINDKYVDAKELSEQFYDYVITSYGVRNPDKKKTLYALIEDNVKQCSDQTRIKAEIKLLDSVKDSYEKGYISGITIGDNIDVQGVFSACRFENCVFENFTINPANFKGCFFFECRFDNVDSSGSFDTGTLFLKSDGCDEFVIEKNTEIENSYNVYERQVLEQFWKPGYSNAEPRRTYTAMFKGVPETNRGAIKEAIGSLLKKGIIRELNVCYELNFSEIVEIKRILGR